MLATFLDLKHLDIKTNVQRQANSKSRQGRQRRPPLAGALEGDSRA
jgi:hypothetical protein